MNKPEPLKDKKYNRFQSYPGVDFYDGESVKSAVDWLKEKTFFEINCKRIGNKYYLDGKEVRDMIDKAFEDVVKQ